jgi:hypothetical protein
MRSARRALGDAMKCEPTALLILKVEIDRYVRSFNWREGTRVARKGRVPRSTSG